MFRDRESANLSFILENWFFSFQTDPTNPALLGTIPHVQTAHHAEETVLPHAGRLDAKRHLHCFSAETSLG